MRWWTDIEGQWQAFPHAVDLGMADGSSYSKKMFACSYKCQHDGWNPYWTSFEYYRLFPQNVFIRCALWREGTGGGGVEVGAWVRRGWRDLTKGKNQNLTSKYVQSMDRNSFFACCQRIFCTV